MLMRLSGAALVLLLALPGLGRAGEDYFLLMFGSQQVPSDPNHSHTFATFVRVTWEGDAADPRQVKVEPLTISWLPTNMQVRVNALLPEDGANFDLHSTLRWCESNCMRVSLWGPYKICRKLYELACKQVDVLDSGKVRYKANDAGYPSDRVSNCIHACSSIIEGYRLRIASPGWGETASFAVLRKYERHVTDPEPQTWVGAALGLDEFLIIYRDWQRPRSGFFGPAYRLIGGERNLTPTYGPPSSAPPPIDDTPDGPVAVPGGSGISPKR